MGVCADCQYGKNNVCPTYNPYQTKCPQNLEEVDKGLKTDKELRDIEICMEYLDGHSTSALASKYNVHSATIRRILNNNGIKPDGVRHHISEEQEKKIVADIKCGNSVSSLRKKYGITQYQIQNIKKKYGLLKKQPENLLPKPKEDTAITFYIRNLTTKPIDGCYPEEVADKLVWAIDISSLEELMTLQDTLDCSLILTDRYLDLKGVNQ